KAAQKRHNGQHVKLIALANKAGERCEPARDLAVTVRLQQPPPDAATIKMNSGSSAGGSNDLPLWRDVNALHQLIFLPPEDGFLPSPSEKGAVRTSDVDVKIFRLGGNKTEYHLGRVPSQDDLVNDFALPHETVNR